MAIKCPKCQADNPDTQKFCGECATPLTSQGDVSVTKTLETPIEELPAGSTLAGRYRIIEELGKGGMGRVYKAHDQEINEDVAIKLLKTEIAWDEKTIERFRNELKVARSVSHKHVCRMYDIGKEDEKYFITMEYVSGEDLKSLIRGREKISENEVLRLAKQVCEGLAEAHELGVVHRDLKPQNIMIDEKGNAKIMDFGIARSLKAPGVTATGMIIGTPDYISPEQAEGEEADQRSDIYSLGVILYEMVTGTVPFKGDTALSVALKHKAQIPRDPRKLDPQISDNLSRLILICMEKDRERRYQTAEALLNDLQNIEEGLPLGTKIRPRRATFIQTLIRKKLLIPALVVTLAIIAVAIWQLLPRGEVVSPVTSDKPSIAIMYFKNNTGEEGLDHWRTALSDLLTSDLGQSKFINVLPEDSLYNIHKQLNLLEARSYSTDDLEKVATRGNVESVLLGSYSKAGDNFRIDASIKRIKTGEITRIEAVEGRGEESYFAMTDELTIKIKENLELSEEEIASDIDKEIWKVTTSSPEAYKYYSEGRKYHRQGSLRQSVEFMEKAIAIDPEFAMAYRSLAVAYGSSGYLSERRKYFQKAVEFADRLPDIDRYQIIGDFYSSSEITFDKAIEAYKKITQLYPDRVPGNTSLGVLYNMLEEWDRAIEQFEAVLTYYVTHESYIVSPYYNIAYSFAAKGLYEKAREFPEYYLNNIKENAYLYAYLALTYLFQHKYDLALVEADKAISIAPDNAYCKMAKGDIYLLMGDSMNAEKEYQKILGLKSQHSHMYGRDRLRALYLSQGRFDRSEEQAQQGVELAQKLDNQVWKLLFHRFLSYIYLKSGNIEKALKECNMRWSLAVELDDLSQQRWSLHQKGLVYLEMNSIEEAQRAADELKETINIGFNKKHKRYYDHLMGMIELKRNNFSEAAEYFKEAISLLSYQREADYDDHALLIDSLALAYYKVGDFEKAEKEYEKIIGLTTGRLNYGDLYAKAFYMLGKIHEQKGQKAEAIEHYQKFLSLWKDADTVIAEVEDAKKRLVGLKDQ